MASSRKSPTNPNISSYGGAGQGRDYTSLSTWEAATDNNLVTAAAGEILEIHNDEVFNDACLITGATTNASYYRLVRAADGDEPNGLVGVGSRIINSTQLAVNQIFRVEESYFAIEDLELSNSIGRVCLFFSSGTAQRMVGVIGTATDGGAAAWFRTRENCDVVNCLAYEVLNIGFDNFSNTGYYYNCTAADCGTGFYRTGGTAIAKNCCACDNTTDFGGTWSKTTCYEGDDTVFEDQAADNYHLGGADTTCRGNGTDLSADAKYPFDDDVDGDTRSAWDIGFDEYQAAGTPDKPSNPSPANAGTGDGEDQTISCTVTDPESQTMDVSFYDQSDDSQIGSTVTDVASGGTASVVWEGLTPSTSYTWYAVADNGSATRQGDDWTFTSGTRGWSWFMSGDSTFRQYISGLKIIEWSSTLLDFIKTVKTSAGRIANTSRYTTTQTLGATDHIVFCDTDGGDWTLSLPAGVEGTQYKIINCGTSGNTLTVDPNGTEQLFGGGAGVAQTMSDGEVINIHYNATEGWY